MPAMRQAMQELRDGTSDDRHQQEYRGDPSTSRTPHHSTSSEALVGLNGETACLLL